MDLMKNVFKFFALGMMLTAFIGATATSIFAQDQDCDATYEKFKTLYRNPNVNDKTQALDLAKKYVADEKCTTPEANKDIVTFLQGQITKLPDAIQKLKDAALYEQFNTAVKASNWDDSFNVGKQIINKFPDSSLDIALVLASIGFDNAAANPPVDKYNTDTINMAHWALDHINDKSVNADKYGAFGKYEYKTTAYPDGKSNAAGWMNYTIGYVTYERLKNQKDALPYLYKATQANSATAKFPAIYKLIGEWYLSEFNRIGIDREAKIKANGDKDNDETLALLALQKGYAERALDAYIRAYNVAPSTTEAEKTYKTAIYNRTKVIYGARYDQKMDNFDKDLAVVQTKPFPDPSTAVTPIVETPPSTTTGETTTPATTTPTTTTGSKTTTTVKKPKS